MAVKTFCDICDIEVKAGDEVSSTTWIENRYTIDNKTNTAPQQMTITKITCGKCFVKIKKIFKDAEK